MARQNSKGKRTEIVSKDVLDFVKVNRKDIPTHIEYGAEEARLENGCIAGGHFKIRSLLLRCGLTQEEIKKAVAKA